MPGSAKVRPIDPAAQVPGTLQRFRYKSMGDEHIICHRVHFSRQGSGLLTSRVDVEGTEDIIVAKPWDLRKSPFDGKTIDGNLYTYGDGSEAQTRDVAGEDQLIVPPYRVDDEIFAVCIGEQVGMLLGPVGSPLFGLVMWLDINVSGRAWAEDYD